MNYKIKNKEYKSSEKITNKSKGSVSIHQDGFGFFVDDIKGLDNLFIPANQLNGVLPTDKVEVEWFSEYDRSKVLLCKVTERNACNFAMVKLVSGEVVPLSAWNININIKSNGGNVDKPNEDELWVARFNGDDLSASINVTMSRLVGPIADPKVRNFGCMIDKGYPDIEVKSNKDLDVLRVETTVVNSWENLPFVTVDGEGTKDFDDAVFVQEKDGGGWKVMVAIADASRYVPTNSIMDKQARLRGATVYMPSHVVPMLPLGLSEGDCSLVEGKTRFVLGVTIDFSENGEVVGLPEFCETQIKTEKRLSYSEVEKIIENNEFNGDKVSANLLAWKNWSATQNAVEEIVFPWYKSENNISVDKKGYVTCSENTSSPKSSKMVENAMVAANQAAANYILREYGIGMYRNQAEPDWRAGRDALQVIGWQGGLPPSENARKWWVDSFKREDGRPEAWTLAQVWSKIQSPAEYQVTNKGHHSLAAVAYTHFTSPIRRYTDLEIHRAIKSKLNGEFYDVSKLNEIVEDCNMAMGRAKKIESEVRQFWMARWWSQQDKSLVISATVKSVKKDGTAVIITDKMGSSGILENKLDTNYSVGDKVEVSLAFVSGNNLVFDLSWNPSKVNKMKM